MPIIVGGHDANGYRICRLLGPVKIFDLDFDRGDCDFEIQQDLELRSWAGAALPDRLHLSDGFHLATPSPLTTTCCLSTLYTCPMSPDSWRLLFTRRREQSSVTSLERRRFLKDRPRATIWSASAPPHRETRVLRTLRATLPAVPHVQVSLLLQRTVH